MVSGSGEDSHAELFLRDGLRATEREQDAALGHLLHRTRVQLCIALDGMAHGIAMLGKGRRVEDDEVVGLRHLVEKAEGILSKGLMAFVTREVQFHVLVHQVHGLLATVDGVDQLGTTTQGIDAESARVAEHVQHATPLRVLLHQGAVISLVYKESRLLTFQPVDMETEAVFYGNVLWRTAQEESVLLSQFGLEREGRLALVVDVLQPLAHHLLQCLGNLHAVDVHADAVGLHDSRLAIHVDDQSGQRIALAVHESEGVVRGISGNADNQSHVQSRTQSAHPELAVDGFVLEREHPHGNAANLPMTDGDELALRGQHTHPLTFLRLSLDALHGTREHPGMEAAETFLLILQ